MADLELAETLLVVALHEEARPLCRLLGLRADETARGFRAFRRGDVHLVVSGPGRERAGLATAWGAARLRRSEGAVFLNVGVAGSGLDAESRPLGHSLLAHSIVERQTGRRFFPSICFETELQSAAVITCDEVETGYREPALFEMEASGFYSAARRFATAELIQCLKIVSDHAESPVTRLDGAAIASLATSALPAVEELLLTLSRLTATLDDSAVRSLAAQWAHGRRLSKTQERRLATVARRLVALEIPEPDAGFFQGVDTGGGLLARLEAYVDARSVARGGGPT